MVSEIMKVFNHITLLVKHGASKPVLCVKCHRYVTRIDTHLKQIHHLKGDKLENLINLCKDESENGKLTKLKFVNP